MLPFDNIFNVILKHRLPISRGNRTVRDYLELYFASYINDLREALKRTPECTVRQECYDLLEQKIDAVFELCNDILKVIDYHDSANMVKLYNHFPEMMKKIELFLFTKDIGSIGYERFRMYYRIRTGNESLSRRDLFHIPLNKRDVIKSYRYSIPGYPCLYLSTGLELCWFECGMPKEFSYSRFNLEASDSYKVKLLDFTIDPVDLVSSVSCSYYNNPEDSDLIDNFIIKYIVLFPLRVACSLEVSNRDVSFIEEYVFPQQLLLWIRENDRFDGIAYRTSSAIEKAREWNYINVVMPAKEIEGAYCNHLNRLFTVTEPSKVEVRNIIGKHDDQIEKVKDFVMHTESKYYHGYSLYPYREIISLCKTFIQLCDMLRSDNYSNAEGIYQTLDTLNLFAYLICDNKQSIMEKSMNNAKSLYYNVEENAIFTELEEILNQFEADVKPILFEFWSYVGRIGSEVPVDQNSYQHIL